MDETEIEEDHPEADDGSRLDELDDRISSVRSQAVDAVEGVDEDEEKAYADSGDGEAAAEDDQNIAPG